MSKTNVFPIEMFWPDNIKRWKRSDFYFNSFKNSIGEEGGLNVIDLLKEGDLSEDEAIEFLTKITADSKTSKAFIDEIIRDEDGNFAPEKSKDVVRVLVNSLGGKENFERWYTASDGYLGAFKRYGEEFYNEAKSVDELCEFLPNWGPWALKRKYRQMNSLYPVKTNGNCPPEWPDSFTIGKLPREFGGKEGFRDFILGLRDKINSGEGSDLNGFVSKFGFKSAKIIEEGGSPKYKVILDDKYIVKMDKYKDNYITSDYYNDIKDAEPDSTLLNAVVDYYISCHCPKADAKMYFYDELTSASVYEFVNGKNPRFITDGAGFDMKGKDFKEAFSGLNKIGIDYTDYYSGNFIETKNGVKCIDSGHSVYFDILKPGIGGLTISLPTRTGFNPLEFHGRLAEI